MTHMTHSFESWWVVMSHEESLWVTMSHYESWGVIISHTYAYSLAYHIISTFTGFTTWLRSQPWFGMMQFHKKWIWNAKSYQNIYVSSYFVRFQPWSSFFNDELPSGCIINRGWNHIFWKADSLNIRKTCLVYHKSATGWRLNHIIIIIYRNFAHMNSSIFKSNFRAQNHR